MDTEARIAFSHFVTSMVVETKGKQTIKISTLKEQYPTLQQHSVAYIASLMNPAINEACRLRTPSPQQLGDGVFHWHPQAWLINKEIMLENGQMIDAAWTVATGFYDEQSSTQDPYGPEQSALTGEKEDSPPDSVLSELFEYHQEWNKELEEST